MATWQTTFHLVPRGTELADGFDPSDASPLDLGSPEPEIDVFCARGPSWSADLTGWGSYEGNRLELFREGGAIDSVEVRLDLRGPIRDFANGILGFARRHDLVLYFGELNELIEPTHAALAFAVKRSSALRFVTDPEAYLKSLGG
jgi:hypothetical protein